MPALPDLPHTLVLIIGLLMIAKATWALLAPQDFKETCAWWFHIMGRARTVFVLLSLTLALGLWASFMIYRSFAHWILLGLGLLYYTTALQLLRDPRLTERLEHAALRRSTLAIRALALATLTVAYLLVWIVITDL